MIVKETITLSKFGNRKLKYYKNLGYDISKDEFEVKVSDLTNKQKFKKSNLNTNLSESEYMKSIGCYKIWDCGKTKFEKII